MALAATGKPLYERLCASCHDPAGEHFGTVTPQSRVGTDPERMLAFDKAMAARMNTIGTGKPWAFHRFRSTNGYANHSLEGIWLRAPYLHNGSVPTMRQFLNLDERMKTFCRGNNAYDPLTMGIVTHAPDTEGRCGPDLPFEFDASLIGNSNAGHDFPWHRNEVAGDPAKQAELEALLVYLRTQ
jgi:hypothetical protein